MAIKTKEELLSSIKTVLGDNTDDNTLSLFEDISDTYDDISNKAKGDGKDWKAIGSAKGAKFHGIPEISTSARVKIFNSKEEAKVFKEAFEKIINDLLKKYESIEEPQEANKIFEKIEKVKADYQIFLHHNS